MRVRWPAVLVVPLLLVLAACDHSTPFDPPDTSNEGPFSAAEPVRLTYALGGVHAAAWTPAGDSILYSWRVPAEPDRCIAVLPAAGGSIGSQVCPRNDAGADSVHLFDLPAVAEGGALAYKRIRARANSNVFLGGLFAASRAAPDATTPLMNLPGTVGGVLYQDATVLRWRDDGRLVALGMVDEIWECTVVPPATACDDQLVRHARDVLLLDPAGSATPIAGTRLATSAAPGANADELFLTFAGDTRLHRLQISTGTLATVHDFGAAGIARAAHHAAGRVVVVVGGSVGLLDDNNGPLQFGDAGGTLWVVGADGSGATPVGGGLAYLAPALSPDGSAVVAEADPLATGNSSLYRIDLE